MKKSVVRSTLGLLALLVMLSSAAWAAGANEDYQADEDVQNTPYASLDGGAAEDQLWDFAEAWRLAAEGGVVTLQQDVLAAAEDAPEGIFVQVPEDGQVTLNLNGHRLAGEDVPCLIYVGARGRLTVTDGGQSGGQIVGVIGVDDGADDPGEWGQVELLGDVEVVDPNVMVLEDPQAYCTFATGGGQQSGSFEDMWNLAAQNYGSIVTLCADVTAKNGSFGDGIGFESGAILVPQDAEITLELSGHTLDRGLVRNTISIPQGKGSVILVKGTLHLMGGGALGNGTITGGKETERPDSYERFGGGGINVAGTGTLNMSGGTITGNEAYHGGGVYVAGRFTMTDGEITSNLSTNNGGGVYLANGASGTSEALFDMRGGRISDNKVKASTYNTQDSCNGGGVYIEAHDRNDTTYAKFTMYGGEISGNSCTSTDNNQSGSSWSGGGVCVGDDNTFEMTGGKICSNNASGGGGVMVYGTATISNAEISNNTASNGGGIETAGPSYAPKLTLRDTTITGNIATGKGGGIFPGDAFDVSGTVIIHDNNVQSNFQGVHLYANNVYFSDSNNPICISGALSENSVIHVVTPSNLSSTAYPLLIAKPADGVAVDLNLKNFVSDDTSGNTFLRKNEDGNIVLETKTGKHIHSLDVKNDYTPKSEEVWFDQDLAVFLNTVTPITINSYEYKALPSGNYYLSSSLILEYPIVIQKDQTVRICLNYKNIEGGNARGAFYVQLGGTLDLCDCGGGWRITGVQNGDAAVRTAGVFNLHSGKIDSNSVCGVALEANTCVFNMYGGAVSNNTTSQRFGAGVNGIGSFNMYGGKISNNTNTTTADSAFGGGVFLKGLINSPSKFKMFGGEISGNKITASTGDALGYGGGVYLQDTTFEMSGGKITGNTAKEAGGVSYVETSVPMKISGDIQITGNTSYDVSIDGSYNASPDIPFEVVGALGANAQIGFLCANPSSGNYVVAKPAADVTLTEADANKFTHEMKGDGTPVPPTLVGGNIVLEGPHKHKLNEGLTGVTAGNTPVRFDKRLSSSNVTSALNFGNYYLTEDITITAPITIIGSVNLCLNGHSITMNSADNTTNSHSVFKVNTNATLNICDCEPSTEHKITFQGQEITIHGGLITGGCAHSDVNNGNNGGGIYLTGGGRLNLYGGTIAGNSCSTVTGVQRNACGGGVCLVGSADFYMYGGVISYNEAYPTLSGNYPGCGGGVALDGANTRFYMKGGKIQNNCASLRTPSDGSGVGGGIYVINSGSVNIADNAEISQNHGTSGGGVYVSTGCDLTISGNVQICNNFHGSATSRKNNVYLYNGSRLKVEDGQSLVSTARIGISTHIAPTPSAAVPFTSSGNIGASSINCFFADNSENYNVAWNAEQNYFELQWGASSGDTHKHSDNKEFSAFPSPVPTSLSSGSYYLTGDITLTDTVTIPGSGSVNLCLNGHTITGPAGKAAFKVPSGAALNIYNDEGTNGFTGLSGSGGIQVDGGGKLSMVPKTGEPVKYEPGAGSGGKVTVGSNGQVTTPGSGSGEGPTPGTGNHETDHPDPDDSFTPINTGNFTSVTSNQTPAGYTGALPAQQSAYRFLDPGRYYLDGNFTMPYALIVVPGADGAATDFCLYGSNLGADNDTWLYEMQHVFWVPDKAVLNVLDCQRDLHIVWLYGGRVFLKNGARVNISGKVPDYITTIEMDNGAEGEVKIEYVDQEPVMTLPKGATLTQKAPGKPDQIITNRDGVLEMTTSGAATKITPPSESASINLKLPETVGEEAPAIVLEAPAGSTVQTADGPEIKLEQPGEVAADGTISSPKVTVTTEEAETTVTAPSGGNVQVNADGEAQVPEGSTVTTGGETVKIEEIGGAADAVTVLPSGQIQLPAGGEVALGSSKRGSATIVIALPGGAGTDTIDITDTGVTPPKGSTVTVKPKKESVTIVIALPYPEDGGEPPEIRFSNNGALILPEGTKVTTRNGDQETTTPVTEDAPYLDPETGELTETDLEAPPQPSEPVNPNEPTGETKPVTPGTPVENPNVKVEMDDEGEITVTPKDPAKPPVVIKPQPKDPDQPGETPAPPVVDQTGKVFIDTPFNVETKDGTDITAEKGGSVDPDGNVTGETVTVEQKKPDGTTESKTTLTAPEGDAVKVGPDGESKAPVGTEVKQDDVTVKIDDVPDPKKPVTVKPDGTVDLPNGSEITVTPNPDQPEQKYTVKIDQVPDPEQPVPVKPGGGVDLPGGSQITITPKPDQPGQPEQKYTVTIPADKGGEVKPDPDGKITLPPGAKVKGPDGKETTISSSGGAIDPSTGVITGAAPSDVPGGNFPIIDGGGNGSGGSSPASYVIMASASIGGGISPDKRVTVRSGADQTFTIKPDEGYVISDVLVDSESVGAVDSYTFRNVRSGHTIQALFVAEGMSGHGHQGPCPKDETCPIWPYTDSIPTDWYHDGVHYCIENDLMIGTAPVLWEPDIPLSRAMMAQVLYNKAGQPAVGGDGVFSDVDREWYWPAITWGGRSNVLLGYDDGSYGPQNPITREQLATLLWRYAGQPQFDGELSFSDAAQVSDYAKQALNWASRQGVIAGYPDGTFRPQANASRAEAAQMIMRYFEL